MNDPGGIRLASGMRQLAGKRTKYRRAHAAPLAGLISDRAEYNIIPRTESDSSLSTIDTVDQ